ncbi:MAG: type IV toxin-antitoxin system AbiEi family antitoxin domain-containing protein [Bdellovibrionales bacterium]|nr:type IV toxin-antitoxin system AbiEi family antitoxin domain-containing protein [Bdellovibrionales bacterium]
MNNNIYIEKCESSRDHIGMDKNQENKLKKLGIFTLAQANELGITQQSLSKLVKQEKIKRVDRGIFLHPEANLGREYDFQIACAKLGPDAVIGKMSALFYYNLVEQVPKQTWVLVPPHKITSNRSYRLIRTQTPLIRASSWETGIRLPLLSGLLWRALSLPVKLVSEQRSMLAERPSNKSKLHSRKLE